MSKNLRRAKDLRTNQTDAADSGMSRSVYQEWEGMADRIWDTLQSRPSVKTPSPPAPLPRGERGEENKTA